MPLLETKGAASAQGFGEFAKVGAANYIEDVFSTWLYTGTSSTQNIVNGIDLSTKGGLVWLKQRDGTWGNYVTDTARGAGNSLLTNSTSAQSATDTSRLSAFNTNGFSIGNSATVNGSGSTMASWTFRKQPKFFDVVTYTGNGANNRQISHSLGSTPGCIIIKNVSVTTNWAVWHRSVNTSRGVLNLTNAFTTSNAAFYFGDGTSVVQPTSTNFTIGEDGDVNNSGNTFVAYLFAHDAGGFGLTGTDNVISCGSFTTDGSGYSPDVSLGYEPQWVLLKPAGGTGAWLIVDTMRGWVNPAGTAADDANLRPNVSDAEALNDIGWPTATGFNAGYRGTANNQWIYIAIRRGPMKTPTTGTSVFSPVAYTGNGTSQSLTAGFPIDLSLFKYRAGASNSFEWFDRLRGTSPDLRSAYNFAELATTTEVTSFASNTQVTVGASSDTGGTNVSGYTYVLEAFRRAPGFFDVVCYTGTGSNTTQAHNLGVVPELMITKRRDATNSWPTFFNMGVSSYRRGSLNLTDTPSSFAYNAGYGLSSAPTSTAINLDSGASMNGSGGTYVAYLFASCPGVSKVGSYTGTGTTQQINCGFTGGARFVLIRRTDDAGDWYCWDSSRGIVSGNDPYLEINTTDAEVTNTDYIDTYSAGFEISSTAPAAINANGGSFIFLAIA